MALRQLDSGQHYGRQRRRLAVNVGGPNDFTTAQAAALLSALSTVNNDGLLAGSSFGFDTTNAQAPVTYSGSIANSIGSGGGSIGLVKFGSGTLAIGGTLTYSGTTTVNGGTLRLGLVNTLPFGAGAGNVVVASGGILDLNGNNTAVNGLSGAGTVDTLSGGTPTLAVGNNNVSDT